MTLWTAPAARTENRHIGSTPSFFNSREMLEEFQKKWAGSIAIESENHGALAKLLVLGADAAGKCACAFAGNIEVMSVGGELIE